MLKQAVLLFLSLTTVAFAGEGNEGPMGMPPRTALPLAETRTSVVFHPRPYAYGVRVYDNGNVVAYRQERNEAETRQDIAVLSAAALSTLQTKVNNLVAGEVEADDPEAPSCYDAPMTTFTVIQRNTGTEIEVAREAGCKEYNLHTQGAYEIAGILRGLRILAGAVR